MPLFPNSVPYYKQLESLNLSQRLQTQKMQSKKQAKNQPRPGQLLAAHLAGNAELGFRWLKDIHKAARSEMSLTATDGKNAEHALREISKDSGSPDAIKNILHALDHNDPEHANAIAAELRETTPESLLPKDFRNNVARACIGRQISIAVRTIDFYIQGNQPTAHFADSMARTRSAIQKITGLDSGSLVGYFGDYPVNRTEYVQRALGAMHDVAFASALTSVPTDGPKLTPEGEVIPPSYIAVLKQFDDRGGFNHVLNRNRQFSQPMRMAVSAIHDARLFETVVATAQSSLDSNQAHNLALSYTEFASSKEVARVMGEAVDTLSRAVQPEGQSRTAGVAPDAHGLPTGGVEL